MPFFFLVCLFLTKKDKEEKLGADLRTLIGEKIRIHSLSGK